MIRSDHSSGRYGKRKGKIPENIKEFKRGETPLFISFPLPLIKGKGDKGGWGYQIKTKEEEDENTSLC